MTWFVFTCIAVSAIGSICGIGGGILLKPLLDLFTSFNTVTVNYISSCVVLSMAAFSTASMMFQKEISKQHIAKVFFISFGAIAGGFIGKGLFVELCRIFTSDLMTKLQALCLAGITAATCLLMIRVQDRRCSGMEHRGKMVAVGCILGTVSSFLGIGGGPMNIVALKLLCGTDNKDTRKLSLYIIFFSQLISVIIGTRGYLQSAKIDMIPLLLACLGGIAGGIAGRFLNKRLSEKAIARLFSFVMGAIIVICGWNLFEG